MRIVILGLSITSSWGNGHATTYRALTKALARRGHSVRFLERDVPWYASQRDMPDPPHASTALYGNLEELQREHADEVAEADLVVFGSYVPEGVAACEWVLQTAGGVTAFYDIDTPVTLAKLARDDFEYLHPDLIPRFDLYLSFTGGPTLDLLETRWGAQRARPLYCAVDADKYAPVTAETRWEIGYLGTYSPDRQPGLKRLLLDVARARKGSYVVAGPQYPDGIAWPENVARIDHLPPAEHPRFFSCQRFTLNLTRADMVAAGYAPSVRLFEAAACGAAIISDWWDGLDSFLSPGEEVLIAHKTQDVCGYLEMPERQRCMIGAAARNRILAAHTADDRARELETYVAEVQQTAGV